MKFSQIALIVILSFAVAFITAKYMVLNNGSSAQTIEESAYDRVLRTGELRCGYIVSPPHFSKDPITGVLGGIWYDFTEAIADHLGLKVIWAEEVGYGDVSAALNAKRVDVFCGALWTAGKRVRVIDFLHPSSYEPMLVYVRTGDHRFDADVRAINDSSVRISAMDGEGSGLVAAEEFPKAKIVSLPQLTSFADMYNQVVTNKADVVLAAPAGIAFFLKNNPDALRPIVNQPIRVFPCALAVKYGEDKLRDMLNQAQDDVIDNGTMNKIISKYEINKGDFWRVVKPYAQP